MIKSNQKRLNRMHVVLDALVIAGAYILSWFVTIKSSWFDTGGVLPDWFYMGALLVLVPLYLLLYTIFQLFTPKRVQGRRQEFANAQEAQTYVDENKISFSLAF